jgi:signal peptidase I
VKAEKAQAKQEAKVERLTVEQKVRREIIAWFWVGLVFLLINGAIGQARVIPSGSMENTLLIGDHLIMSRIGYDAGIPFTNLHLPLWRNPKRQQIIIFKPPFDPTQPDYVKRADCRATQSISTTTRCGSTASG